MTRDEFERAFHSRTLAYQPSFRADTRPIIVRIGPDAQSRPGHTLLVALVNQLARAHQHLNLQGILDHPLECPMLFGLTNLRDATVGLAQAINPFITVTTGPPVEKPLVTIAVGQTSEPADIRLGCDGWCATVSSDARIDDGPTSILGAMLASCIGAAYSFHRLLGISSTPGPSYSLWEYGVPGASQGPELRGALNVGRVLQVGAGGVGAALDYWAALLGIAGLWMISDGDAVDVSNLNRQLVFLAAHAGFPHLPAQNKAEVCAALLGSDATASPYWYDEAPDIGASQYDVVLALANERGIRAALQQRQPAVMLHATTSPNWEAQFHRHVAGQDDCITCRIPIVDGPPTRCAETRVNAETSTDAALPFLSGAAGLLLLAGLIHLQHDQLTGTPFNFMSLNLKTAAAVAQHLRRQCNDGCSGWAADHIRAVIDSDSRYAALDPARR